MIHVWRIVKEEHVDHAFDGEGAKKYGGHWNEIGTSMVYTSQSLSLAALQLFINLDATPPEELKLMAIEAQIPKNLIHSIPELPNHWNKYPIHPETRIYGSGWVEKKSSVALRVPSCIITSEFNYLINPNHFDFNSLKILSSTPFSFMLSLIQNDLNDVVLNDRKPHPIHEPACQ